jgi:predicted ATPase
MERFVGRVAELRRLEQLLDSSLRGDARLVTVVGRAGVGKSALVARLLLDARRRGAAYVVAPCQASAFPGPYGPWIELIEGLRAARVVPERRWHSLPRLVPSLAGTQRSIRLADDAHKPAEASLVDEICELLAAAASTRPLVLVIEDIEHADYASWDVCDRLAARLGSERLLLCLTTDDSSAAAARGRFASCRRHYELRLDDLSPDDRRQWVGELFADAATARASAEYLAAAGATTPLWNTHLLHALVDDGHLAFNGGTWRLTAPPLARPPVAPNDASVFVRRIAALSPKTRAILGELGVIGDGFELDVALAAGIGDEAELLDAIDEALAAAILREEGGEPGAAFAFTHRSIAVAARETIDVMRLRRVHERIARGLEQVRPVALFEIAEHYDRAALADRAFEYALLAAARAVGVQAYADAARAYGRARAHVTTPAQRRRLDELMAELPARLDRAGVA